MIKRIELIRVFESNGVNLPDPDPSLDVESAVRIIAMAGRPELMSAEIRGPETRGAEQVYTLHRAVGTKGAVDKQRKTPARGKLAQALAKIEGLRSTTVQVLTRGDAEALSALSNNKGANGLVLPGHSMPWLG